MEFILGIVGAVLCIVLFFAGAFAGWTAHAKYTRQVTAESLSEAQKRQLREEEEAWRHLHNYSVEDAYQIQQRSKG